MTYSYIIVIVIQLILSIKATDISFSSNCDCGFNEPKSNTNWNEMWHMNFEEKTNFIGGNQHLYTHKDLFFSNYNISPKFNDSYARVFRKESVVIKDESLEIGVIMDNSTSLSAIVNNVNQRIKCGGIGTTRQDFLYGSFRSYMRTTKVNGTVTGMFIYHPEGEIDIEMLGSVKPSQAFFAMHPGLIENGKASKLTHGNYIFNFDPTQDYHEYRIDWYPNLSIFYVDGIESYRISTNVLSQPSRIMFNHWTDGNAKFSQGPAKESAYINIKNMTFFFNSSDTSMSTPKCINVNNTCNIERIVTTLKDKNTVFDSYLTSGDVPNSNPPNTPPSPPPSIDTPNPLSNDSPFARISSLSSSTTTHMETFIYLFITVTVAWLL